MPESQDVQRLSPDKLVTMFSRSHIALCLIVAVGLHVAIVAATSTNYIRDTWIDPEGAQRRKMDADLAREAKKASGKASRRAAATRRAATRPAKRKPAAGDVPERARNNPVYRATTRKAAPNEIPKDPGELNVPE